MNKRNNIAEVNNEKLWQTMTKDEEWWWTAMMLLQINDFYIIPILIIIRINTLISVAAGPSAAKWHRRQWSSVLAEANTHHAVSMVLKRGLETAYDDPQSMDHHPQVGWNFWYSKKIEIYRNIFQ